MRLNRRILTFLLCFALVPSVALISRAQDQQDQSEVSAPPPPADAAGQTADDNRPDPPSRAARLQYMSGSVSVQPHGTDDWVAGVLNRPLTDSDNIWADKNSRAEISVGTGVIRIGSESSLTLTNIDENTVQLQLHQGEMNLHVRRLYDNEKYEVDTPNQAFTVIKPGDYRFDVDSQNDSTLVTVRRGEGESTGTGPAVRIREGQQANFANGTDTTNADLHSAPSPDDFDQWARSRDERMDQSASAKYVSPDVVGYEDLDEYGQWRDTPQYGSVWVPSGVGAGWAPY
ncbi:MAG TPA: FecR domain-containing protein, partial [Terriglobales bacterium]